MRDHLVGHCEDFGYCVNGKPLEDFEHRHDLAGSPVQFFAFRQINV